MAFPTFKIPVPVFEPEPFKIGIPEPFFPLSGHNFGQEDTQEEASFKASTAVALALLTIAAVLVGCVLIGFVVLKRSRDEKKYKEDIEKMLGPDLQSDPLQMEENGQGRWRK